MGRTGGAAWTLNGGTLTMGIAIPVGRMCAPLLVAGSGLDSYWDAQASDADVMRQLNSAPGAPAHTGLEYPDAGHCQAGDPPYFPYDFHDVGGTPAADALASEQCWPRMRSFINGIR